MTITYVSSTTADSSGAATATIPFTTSTGNCILLFIAKPNTFATVSSITDTGGSLYSFQGAVSGNGRQLELWSTTGKGSVASTAVTITLKNDYLNQGFTCVIGQYSGVVTVGKVISSTMQSNNTPLLGFGLTAAYDWIAVSFQTNQTETNTLPTQPQHLRTQLIQSSGPLNNVSLWDANLDLTGVITLVNVQSSIPTAGFWNGLLVELTLTAATQKGAVGISTAASYLTSQAFFPKVAVQVTARMVNAIARTGALTVAVSGVRTAIKNFVSGKANIKVSSSSVASSAMFPAAKIQVYATRSNKTLTSGKVGLGVSARMVASNVFYAKVGVQAKNTVLQKITPFYANVGIGVKAKSHPPTPFNMCITSSARQVTLTSSTRQVAISSAARQITISGSGSIC